MRIEEKEILIRNAEIKDADLLKKWWADGRIMAHAGFPLGLKISKEEIEGFIKKEEDKTSRTLIIEYNSTPIGEMSYRRVENNMSEIGIKICDEDMQSKGLGFIIMNLFIKELFENLNYDKIILDTNLENIRAQRLYEKLGFIRLRVNKDAWRNQVGILQSSVDYEITNKDFFRKI